MSARAAAWLAWSSWALAMALAAAGTTITLLNGPAPAGAAAAGDVLGVGLMSLIVLVAFSTVGALVAARHPANPIGWIFCAVGLSFGLTSLGESYAVRALLVAPGSLPGGAVMAWAAGVAQGPAILGAFAYLLLLFPDGRLPAPRWRLLAWLTGGVTAAVLLLSALQPGPLQGYAFVVTNPFGIEALAALDALFAPVLFLLLAALLGSAVALLLRFRRARGAERQQLKWFASAGALLATVFAVGPIIWSVPELSGIVWTLLFFIAVATIPIAAGIAILRYRLYDIDLIINRALVYGALTAVLALVYLVSVVLLQELFRLLTGQSSNLAIVVATLTSAALFQPLRRRLQAFIDRRFYRSKYDAARILAAFSTHLRDEVDLSTLTDELIAVVDETVQPASISLWLKAPPAPGPASPSSRRPG